MTGTPVKGVDDTDLHLLSKILADDDREIDHTRLNELLLLVNKDRMAGPMFRRFFGQRCRVSELTAAVEQYQKIAMLRYGNFIYAYRTLSRITDENRFSEELGHLCTEGDLSAALYTSRAGKLLDIESIPRTDTPLVGYLSATLIVGESARVKLLGLADTVAGVGASWNAFEAAVRELSKPEEQQPILAMLRNYRIRQPQGAPGDFMRYIREVEIQIEARHTRLLDVQATATRNQDVYLTWDHMESTLLRPCGRRGSSLTCTTSFQV
jgi:hypothetical protein